jgi:hypothetical protein
MKGNKYGFVNQHSRKKQEGEINDFMLKFRSVVCQCKYDKLPESYEKFQGISKKESRSITYSTVGGRSFSHGLRCHLPFGCSIHVDRERKRVVVKASENSVNLHLCHYNSVDVTFLNSVFDPVRS